MIDSDGSENEPIKAASSQEKGKNRRQGVYFKSDCQLSIFKFPAQV
jgi:hypothetical protein